MIGPGIVQSGCSASRRNSCQGLGITAPLIRAILNNRVQQFITFKVAVTFQTTRSAQTRLVPWPITLQRALEMCKHCGWTSARFERFQFEALCQVGSLHLSMRFAWRFTAISMRCSTPNCTSRSGEDPVCNTASYRPRPFGVGGCPVPKARPWRSSTTMA